MLLSLVFWAALMQTTQPAPPSPGITALCGPDSPLRPGERVDFFGDSITWQDGYLGVLRSHLRPASEVDLRNRGINGGKSTDLRDGVKDLYGCTQAPFAQVLAEDQPAAVVVFIGINDVWHGKKGNSPAAFEAALRTLVTTAQARQVAVVLATPSVIGERPRGRNPLDAQLDEYAAIALRVAGELGATPCDLRAALFDALARRNPEGKDRGVFTHDQVHLSPDGDALVADRLAAALAVALRARKPVEVLPLVPWPKQLQTSDGTWDLAAGRSRIVCGPALHDVAAALADALVRMAGVTVEVAAGEPRAGDVVLSLDPALAAEACSLVVSGGVSVRGGSATAIAQGATTLLQLLRAADGVAHLPRVRIEDRPAFAYRGLLVDVARQWHSPRVLEQLIELCRLYKIRYLQLHLTDDQSFTFPSRAFPRLATKGRSYTIEQLEALERFATARGVTLVPELDMPGHCGAMIAAMPELFRAHERHHATLHFARPEVLAALDTLIDELLAVFRSTPYFHLGGDEADLAHVHEVPEFQAAFAREQVADAHELYRWFVVRMHQAVRKRGKETLVWEGFGPGGKPAIPKDLTVMAYESLYYLPDQLVRDGYPVINASWQPLYVVNQRAWPPSEIYAWNTGYWHHFIDSFPAFKGIQVPPSPLIRGAQMCAWEQPETVELPSLRLRLPAMAERVWNPDAGRSYADFAARLAATDALLTALVR